MPRAETPLARARSIDPDRAGHLERELGSGRDLGVLLGTAFPPLTPVLSWQLAALDDIQSSGWRGRRQQGDIVSRLFAAIGELSDLELVSSRLRRAVWAEKARIALRELLPPNQGGASIDVTAAELADLAAAAIEVALAEAAAHVSGRFGEPRRNDGQASRLATLGMGKLGGRELNAGSDVDLIFVYDTDEGSAGELPLHDFWTRVVRRACQTIETPSADGMIWRVDLRLRPEGGPGAIVNSMAAAERYYETWGRTWERAALLRARPIATDATFGQSLMHEVVTPFVFRRKVDPSIATALAELVQRSRAEIGGPIERDLKHGPGGIREAEFFAQSLQLIWGGREPSLHVQGTLSALFRLRSRGFATDREVRVIAGAYRLLRRAEHRIQWMTGVQTHLLPEASDELERLARSLEYKDSTAFVAELRSVRAGVEELFRSLAPEAPRPLPKHHALLVQLEEHDPALPESTERAFGSADVAEHLRALARRPDALLGSLTRERYPALADAVLDALGESPDPEQSARFLRSFLGRFSTPEPYVKLLAENPNALPRLVWAFGASVFVGEASMRRPELADVTLFGRDTIPDARSVLATELESVGEATSDDAYEQQERLVQAMRRAKHRVMVEVAIADLAGVIDMREATRTLSALADETLERALRFALSGSALAAEPKGLAILAVGKLGGREIGYGSDLDVLFIYDADAAPDGVDSGEYFVRAAQRVIRLISEPHASGAGYELDTRLRPSGSHGMLVTSLSSFSRYHGERTREGSGPSVQSSGAAWERQALIRARVCAGDRELAMRALVVATRAAYEGGAPPADEVHRLRMRMEQELARERAGRYDLKTGRGGLLDIEFATQWLQMKHGRDPRIRTPDTAQALEALHASRYVERADFETLREAYAFLRRLEQRIHVLHATSATTIDARAPGLIQLARRMGMHDTPQRTGTEELLERYRDVTEAVRSSYARVLGITS